MIAIHETSQFRRDIKKLKKQGKKLEKLKHGCRTKKSAILLEHLFFWLV